MTDKLVITETKEGEIQAEEVKAPDSLQAETAELLKVKGLNIDPDLVEKEQAALNNENYIDGMYTLLGLYGPKFAMLVDDMTGNSSKRVLKALTLPLDYGSIKHPTDKEKAAMTLGKRLIECNSVLMIHLFEQENAKIQQQLNKENDNGKDEVKVETK